MTASGVGSTVRRGGLLVVLLAALTAVIAALLPTLPASAATVPAAENNVRAHQLELILIVGVTEHIGAGQRPVRAPSQLQFALVCRVPVNLTDPSGHDPCGASGGGGCYHEGVGGCELKGQGPGDVCHADLDPIFFMEALQKASGQQLKADQKTYSRLPANCDGDRNCMRVKDEMTSPTGHNCLAWLYGATTLYINGEKTEQYLQAGDAAEAGCQVPTPYVPPGTKLKLWQKVVLNGILIVGTLPFGEEGAGADAVIDSGSAASSLDDLAASGGALDSADAGGQLTRAGRAYAKAGEVFGATAGGPAAINAAGQDALEEILTNPGTTTSVMQGGRFAGGFRFVAPNGIGAVFGPDGALQYFGQMTP